MKRLLTLLEFDKIQEILKQYLPPTNIGKSRINTLTPELDFNKAKALQEKIRDWVTLFEQGISGNLIREIPPPEKILKILREGEGVEPALFCSIRGMLKGLTRILEEVKKCTTLPYTIRKAVQSLPQFVEEIRKLDEIFDEEEQIRDEASPRLKTLRKSLKDVERKIKKELQYYIQRQRWILQEEIITIRNGRFVLPVRMDRLPVREFIVHETSASGATAFAEPLELVPLNNHRQHLQSAEQEELKQILLELLAYFRERTAELKLAEDFLTDFAFHSAVFVFLKSAKASFPQLLLEGNTRLYQARHPLLMEKAVPSDVLLGDGYRVLVVSGPNAGGKTVLLKTVGLLTLMAAAGLPIPAHPDSQILIPTQLFIVLGDEQSIESALSTFTARLLPLRSALVHLQKHPEEAHRILFLLDEIGAGTSPEEGVAFAEAVLTSIQEYGSYCIATTHFQKLKELAYRQEGIQNAALLFDDETLQPTYRLHIGFPGPSLGLKVAKNLDFPERILEKAFSLLDTARLSAENLLEQAQKEILKAQRMREEAEHLLQRAQDLQLQMEEKEKRFKKEAYEKARIRYKEAEGFLRNALKKADELIKTLEAEQKHITPIREKKKELLELYRTAILESEKPVPELLSGKRVATYQKGEKAWLPSLALMVEVTEPPDEEGYVKVQSGSLTLRVREKALKPIEPSFARIDTSEVGEYTVSGELLLIGKTAEESIALTDRFLNHAFLTGQKSVRIIHGRGTGKLRRSLQEYLKTHPLVQNFHSDDSSGKGGVTIVLLEEKS